MDGEAEELTRTAITQAKAGDMVALRLCLERLSPARKDAPISFNLPPVQSATDALQAGSSVLAAVAEGEITPDEAGRVMALLTAHKAMVTMGELEQRIEALEDMRASGRDRTA